MYGKLNKGSHLLTGTALERREKAYTDFLGPEGVAHKRYANIMQDGKRMKRFSVNKVLGSDFNEYQKALNRNFLSFGTSDLIGYNFLPKNAIQADLVSKEAAYF